VTAILLGLVIVLSALVLYLWLNRRVDDGMITGRVVLMMGFTGDVGNYLMYDDLAIQRKSGERVPLTADQIIVEITSGNASRRLPIPDGAPDGVQVAIQLNGRGEVDGYISASGSPAEAMYFSVDIADPDRNIVGTGFIWTPADEPDVDPGTDPDATTDE